MSSVSRGSAGPEEDGWWPDPWRSGEFRFFKDGNWTSQLKTKEEVEVIRQRHAAKRNGVNTAVQQPAKPRREPPRRQKPPTTSSPVQVQGEKSTPNQKETNRSGAKKPPPGRVRSDKKLPPVVDKGPQGETPLFPDLKTDKPKAKKAPPATTPAANTGEEDPHVVKSTGKKKPPPTKNEVEPSDKIIEPDTEIKEDLPTQPKQKKAPPVSVVKDTGGSDSSATELSETDVDENTKEDSDETDDTWGRKDSGTSVTPTWKSKVKELQSNIDRNWVLVAVLSLLVLLGPVLIPSEKAKEHPNPQAQEQQRHPAQVEPSQTSPPVQAQSFSYTNKKCAPIEGALKAYYDQGKTAGVSKQMTQNLAKAVSTHKLPKNIEKAARADQKAQNLKRTAQLCGVR